ITTRTERPGSRRATNAMARPRRSATSGVMGGSLATPRMPSVPKSFLSWGSALWFVFFLVTEVHEMQLDPEVIRAHRLNARLQVVFVLAGDAHLRVLDRALHLDFLILDELRDLAGGFDFDALFDFDEHPRRALRSGLGRAYVEEAQRDLALDQLVLHDAERRASAILGGRRDVDAVRGFLDAGARVLEVEPLRELFLRLVQSIVDFRPVRLRNDVERGHLQRA